MPYNMFAEDKRNNYPSAGLNPDQVSSMTYTMDELENGKWNVNPSTVSSPSLVNNNQVNANKSVNLLMAPTTWLPYILPRRERKN